MHRVKVLPSNLSQVNRYRCTCGHCEDVKEDPQAASQSAQNFVLEGFQEIT